MTLVALLLLPLGIIWTLPLCAEAWSLVVRTVRRSRGGRRPAPADGSSRLAFLVPAHDEELLIGPAVASLRAQQGAGAPTLVFVIADNCSDRTASLAQESGAVVLERRDPAHRGKPAAIEWALPRIPLAELDAVVIVDADTVVDPAFASGLQARGPLHDKAVQAHFGSSNAGESWLTRLGSLLEDVRYLGQYPLKRAAGLNVPLTGNGMSLGRGLLSRQAWVSDALTEDLELYARYTAAGEEVDFAPGAVLYAQEASTLGETRTQRSRWLVGKWQVLRRNALLLLTSSKIGPHQKLDAIAELVFPGPVVHAGVAILAAGFLGLSAAPVARAVSLLFLASILPTVAWSLWALARRPDRSALMLDLCRLPLYAVWRLWAGVTALTRGTRMPWERSPRHPS